MKMNKYEAAKRLKTVNARKEHECARCGAAIKSGESHVVEDLGLIRPPPGIRPNRFCIPCYDEHGGSLLRAGKAEEPQAALNVFDAE